MSIRTGEYARKLDDLAAYLYGEAPAQYWGVPHPFWIEARRIAMTDPSIDGHWEHVAGMVSEDA